MLNYYDVRASLWFNTTILITTELGKRIEQLNIEIAIEKLQKTTLLGTARILRKVLEIETGVNNATSAHWLRAAVRIKE